MKVRPYRFLTLIIFVCFSKTYAQTITVDSFKTEISENNLIELFDQNIKDRSDLYNGPAYEAPEKAYKGSVFFNNLNYFVPCNIRYNGYLYKNIPLLYDVFKNVFVCKPPQFEQQIIPYCVKIERQARHISPHCYFIRRACFPSPSEIGYIF